MTDYYLTKDAYASEIEKYANEWFNLMHKNLLNQAKRVCVSLIRQIKQELNTKTWNLDEKSYNFLFVSVISFKAFEDFTDLANLTACKRWVNSNSKVESVWFCYCDCRERVSFVQNYITSFILVFIDCELSKLRNVIDKNWAPIYVSPEVLIIREFCSICGEDIRGCEHKLGKLYNGKLCVGKVEGIKNYKGVAFVETPKDLRCRVWPWKCYNRGKDVYCETRVINATSIDDFLDPNDLRYQVN